MNRWLLGLCGAAMALGACTVTTTEKQAAPGGDDDAGAAIDDTTDDAGAVEPASDAAATTHQDAGATTKKDSGTPPPPQDASAVDSSSPPATCSSTSFSLALTIPMPSTYAAAGFGAASHVMVFYAAGPSYPHHVYTHTVANLLAGSFTVQSDSTLYDTDEGPTLSLTEPQSSSYEWRLAYRGTGYRLLAGSDANRRDETWNLPTLGSANALTSSASPTPYAYARVGGEVWERPQLSTTWSLAADLGAGGITGRAGLAVRRDGAVRTFFVGGPSGIQEQTWPTSLPAQAGSPVVVVASADVKPFGVKSDGCELYASRVNGATLEVLVYRR